MGLNWLGLPVSLTLQTPQFGAAVTFQMRYLHVDEKLPQIARRHHDGGVELDHVALVQSDVVVGGQALENKAGSVTERNIKSLNQNDSEPACVCSGPHSVEVVDDVGGVAASKVRHGHADLLVVVSQVDAHVLLQLLATAQRSVHGVLVENPAVEHVLLRDLQTHTHRKLTYECRSRSKKMRINSSRIA